MTPPVPSMALFNRSIEPSSDLMGASTGASSPPSQDSSTGLQPGTSPGPRKGWLTALTGEQKILLQIGGGLVAGVVLLYVEHDLFEGLTTQAVLGGGVIILVATGVVVWNMIVDPLTAMENPSAGVQSLSEAIGSARNDFISDIVATVRASQPSVAPQTGTSSMDEETFLEVRILVTSTTIANSLIDGLPKTRKLLRRYAFAIVVGIPVVVVVAALASALPQEVNTAIGALILTLLFGAVSMIVPAGDGAEGLTTWDERVKELRGLPYSDMKKKIGKWASEEVAESG